MPCGRFNATTGGFTLTVAADYDATNQDLYSVWTRALIKAAEQLFHATDGQLRIDGFRVANDSYGLIEAELVLHEAGEGSYATSGGFGAQVFTFFPQSLQQVHLMPDCKTYPMIIVHELGHHIFGLGEEYAGPQFDDTIRAPVPGAIDPNDVESTTRVLIDNAERANNALVGVYAGLQFGTLLERRLVTASSAEWVDVGAPFSYLPSQASSPRVFYQDTNATCHEGTEQPPHGFFCIMQTTREAGMFDPFPGGWIPHNPATGAPGTDFCTTSNHELGDITPDTDQSDRNNGAACWSTIATTMAERFGYPVNPPASPDLSPTPGWSDDLVAFNYLTSERRVVLAIDHSGSMAESGKMESARQAALYWVTRLRVEANLGLTDTSFALVAFNHEPQVLQSLASAASLAPDLEQQINALQPAGWTNIAGALGQARQQIHPSATDSFAATQAVVLLTDGVHNWPDGTTIEAVVPELREHWTQAYSVGLGSPPPFGEDAVDMAALESLAASTCASFPLLARTADDAEDRLKEIYDLILNGVVGSQSGMMTPSPADPADRRTVADAPPRKRPSLGELMKAYGFPRPYPRPKRRGNGRFATMPAYVERGSTRASFTLSFPVKQRLWLFLLDPDGKPHPMTGSDTTLVAMERTEFALVDKPKDGLWTLVAFRPEPGPELRWRAFAGSSNRRLVVQGGAGQANAQGAPVLLRASAVWGDRLSGLDVRARIEGAHGATDVTLQESGVAGTGSGHYEAAFVPPDPGRYTGTLRIAGGRGIVPASMWHRLSHSSQVADEKDAKVEVKSIGGRFVRVLPFAFWSGTRPKTVDAERRR